jgi:O-antigen/teichoic acid export membrane protein
MISIVAAPISIGISSLSGLFVAVVFGDKWADVAIPLSILAIQGLLNSLISPANNVLISIGSPRFMSTQATLMAVALVVGIYPVAVFFGLNGVCAFSAALSFGVIVYAMLLLPRILDTSFKEILSPLAPSLVSALITYPVLAISASYVPQELEYLVGLALLGIGVYIAALHILSKGRDLREFVALMWDSFGMRVHRKDSAD